jgi:bisphosphoglycerate-dependent phosphoglycerate mutase
MEHDLPVLFIRHAESKANIVDRRCRQLGLEEDHRYDKSLIDCDIADTGVEQAEQCAKTIKNYNVKVVFTSPLRRAMQTTLKIFENHPNKPKIYALPILREGIYSSCDIPGDISSVLSDPDYSGVDFTYFNKYDKSSLYTYWLEHFMDSEQKKGICEAIEKHKAHEDLSKLHEIIVEKLEKNSPNGIENDLSLFERGIKVK